MTALTPRINYMVSGCTSKVNGTGWNAKENSFPEDPIGILDVSILQENILSAHAWHTGSTNR